MENTGCESNIGITCTESQITDSISIEGGLTEAQETQYEIQKDYENVGFGELNYEVDPIPEIAKGCKRSCGGFPNEAQEATVETQEIIEKIKENVIAKATQTLFHYEAISFKSQIATCRIYFIKVRTGDDAFIHLRVHEILNDENEQVLELIEIQENKSKDEDLEYF